MGDNTIHYMGHVKMMGAVQPFISGAISKTVNMPEDVSVEDVEELHLEAWRLGLKAVALYRDNCKVAQPLATQKKGGETGSPEALANAMPAQVVERIVEHVIVQEPVRQKLPRMRNSKTFSFRVADCHGYATVGEFEDGRPGEVFLKVAKQGSTLAGIMDAFAISLSLGLQYGVPLEAFVEKFTNMRFEPAGMTDDPDLRIATSLVDYIFRRLVVEYVPFETRRDMGVLTVGERTQPTLPGVEEASTPTETIYAELPLDDQPPSASVITPSSEPPLTPGTHVMRASETVLCHVCGDIMQRAGSLPRLPELRRHQWVFVARRPRPGDTRLWYTTVHAREDHDQLLRSGGSRCVRAPLRGRARAARERAPGAARLRVRPGGDELRRFPARRVLGDLDDVRRRSRHACGLRQPRRHGDHG